MKIIGADVFDPALSGDFVTPVRLELIVDSVPESPTFTEINIGQFTILHRHWLQAIYSDEPSWDDTDTRECASIFNSAMSTEDREPVMPVTVAWMDEETGQNWQDFYVKITRVKRILNKLEKLNGKEGYEAIPDPTYSIEKKHSWMLQHPVRKCVCCLQDQAESASTAPDEVSLFGLYTPEGIPVQVGPHRVVNMCLAHRSEWNNKQRVEKRTKELG